MNKVHWIGSVVRGGFQYTACGMEGMLCKNSHTEYDTVLGYRFEAKFKDWDGVTCKRCLRNAHAPVNRCAQK